MLDAAKRCCERWGIAKVTVDDIAAEAGVSRGPRSTGCSRAARTCCSRPCASASSADFFTELQRPRRAAPTRLEDLLVRIVVEATRAAAHRRAPRR